MRTWLIDIRKKKGLAQSFVAEKVGISAPSYCNIENGSRRPSVDNAKEIARLLGFEWTRFYEGEDEGK